MLLLFWLACDDSLRLPGGEAGGEDGTPDPQADVTYHRFFEALDTGGQPRLALVDAGHYETEAVTERLIADRLADAFPALDVAVTRHRTSPMRTFC